MKDRICTLSKNDLKDLVKTYRIPLDLHTRLPDVRFTMDRLPTDAIGIYSEFLWFSCVRVPFSTFLLFVLKYFKVHISQLVPLGLNKVVSFEVVCRDLNIVPTVTLFCVFQCLCKQGDWFSFSKCRNTEDVLMDDGPSILKKWKDKFFLIDRKAVPDYLTWRHSCSCVSDDLPFDGYDWDDVQRICARLIYLREIREEVLVHSGLSSVWFNKECYLVFQRIDDNAEMRIYDFMTLPSWSDAKIVEESHHLSLSLLERVPSHTTALASEGAIIPLPTPDEIAASLPNHCLAKKSKGPSLAEGVNEADLGDLRVELEDRLERDEGVSMRAVSAPIPRLAKRLGAPHFIAVASVFEPSHVGTSTFTPTSGCSLSLGGAVASGLAGKSGAQMDEYDRIPDDDFGTATRGEKIYLKLFPLASGPYHMPYPYEGVSSPLYTREEWKGPHAPECNVLCKDIFKDPDVCRKALDQTISLAELRRTESLLPLELSNHVNVLSSLLVSHGYELNSRYTNLVSSRAHLQEKLDKKKGDVELLRSEVTSLDNKLENLQSDYDALVKRIGSCVLRGMLHLRRDLQNELVLERSKSQGYKDVMDGLKEEVTQFVTSDVEGIVRKLLSSDEFHTALAHVASLGINYGVERGLCIRHTDVEFEAAVQKVFNFHVGAKADFDKALDDFPTTPFPFLSKIVAASEGSLSDVAQIMPDKFVRSATSVAAAPSCANEAPEQVPP
ncbi:hypothetical protein Tco_0079305 [Tanacetum coccineum]